MTVLDHARRLTRRGWRLVPIPFRSKNPGQKGWQQLRLTEEMLPLHFNGHPQNVGLLTGEPSGFVVDVDLDHPLAVQLADEYLPPTPAVFGRKGKPRSHRLYRVTSPTNSKQHKSKSAGMLVELRSTGMQTVIPPSVHESGEEITWEDEDAEPAEIDPDVLHDDVHRLAAEVKRRLGERAPTRARRSAADGQTAPKPDVPAEVSPQVRAHRCLASLLRIEIVDYKDGSRRLFVAACRAVEHDLDNKSAIDVIRTYERLRPFPRRWTDDQITTRLRDAEQTCTRGKAVRADLDAEGLIQLGTHNPVTGKLVLSPRRTLPTAHAFVEEFYQHPLGRAIHTFAGTFWRWTGNRFAEIEDEEVRKVLHVWLHNADRYIANRRGEIELGHFESNPTTVKAALDTIRAHVHLPANLAIPSWLPGEPPQIDPLEILPCRSALFHLPTGDLLEPTPRFFNMNALDFDPDSSAPAPLAWRHFLHQLFDDDIESQSLLQEWFGYCLSADTSQQKMLLIVGPRRSGKGTLARVLTQLVGAGNVCGPTTSSLAGAFGLQPLIGKSLAIVSDARFSGDNITTVVERLLCISGEDGLSIDRKYLGSVNMKLLVRFLFLSNELPKLNDASGALAGRFLILRLTESFYGREDTELTERLLLELPGILNWAIEGWHRLRERGHFQMPQSVEDAVQDLENLASPVRAFVREMCTVGAGFRVSVDDLFEQWRKWCTEEGRYVTGARQTFGRNLAAAVPGVVRRRGTGQQPFYEGIGLKGSSIW